MSEPRWARIIIARELLLDRLKIPADTDLVRAMVSDRGDLDLIVQNDELQPVPDGSLIPQITPIYENVPDGTVFDWGQK